MPDDTDDRAREIMIEAVRKTTGYTHSGCVAIADAILGDLKAAGMTIAPHGDPGFIQFIDTTDFGPITPELRKAYEFYLANCQGQGSGTKGKE